MSLFAISKLQELESLWNNNQIETLNLEYKSQICPSEVAKDISSFANAEGGIIIYGIEEDLGRAKQSTGIDKGLNSEKIQQIVSSSTAPEVPMTIDVIDNTGYNSKEFLVVKIPKSPFYIHQVTTISKFYVRNNTITTPHKYNLMEMKENDIALRYESRLRNKQNQESFIHKKEKQIFSRLNWSNSVIISLVPHVRVPGSVKLTRETFEQFFVHPGTSIITYDHLSTTMSLPTSEGRITDPANTSRTFVEIDNDGSIYCCRKLESGYEIDVFEPIFLVSELLHLLRRFLQKHSSYVGTTFRIRMNDSILIPDKLTSHVRTGLGDRTVSDFEIEHELPAGLFDMKEELAKIFEKWFEAVHIDNSLTLFPETIPKIEQNWKTYDGRMYKDEETS